MTNDGTAAAEDGRDRGERARSELVDFLNDARPAMLVAESLSYLLSTDASPAVDPEEVIELVAAWADEHAVASRQAVSVLYLSALRRVIDADREVPVAGFDPEIFLTTVGMGLTRHCPSSELGGYRAALRDLRLPPAPASARTGGTPSAGEAVEVGGVRRPLREAQEVAVSRLEHEAYMTDADFDEAFADLQVALASRLGMPIHATLSRVAVAASRIFNTGRLRQASKLCAFLLDAFDRLAISAEGRAEAKFSIGPNDLNEGLLAKALNDPTQRALAVPILRFVGYLNPSEALVALAVENRRERRRLLLAAVEAYGPDAFGVVLDHLAAGVSSGQRWYATRNFLYLLSRVDAPDEVAKKRAVEAAGRYVANDQPQVRSAALAALRRVGGRDVVPFVVRALDPVAYPAGSIDDTEALKRHLYVAMETIVETGNEAAVAIVAEIATGGRGSEFDLGQGLRDEACAALSRRSGPLPRRAALVVANHLSHICGRRFKLVTGKLSFGLDAHACRMLSALIPDSPEPECREALENPVLVRVLGRMSGDLA
jgi:hypothetical protein